MLRAKEIRGFTLIELMLTLTVLGVLLTIALPSFRKLLMNYQIRAHTESILNGLQLARGTAVQRNENVQFILAPAGSWTVQTESPVLPIQSRSVGESSAQLVTGILPSTSTTVTFNGLGRVIPNTPASSSITTIDIDVPTSVMSASESKDLRIRILPGGLIKMCDPNVLNATDVTFCPP